MNNRNIVVIGASTGGVSVLRSVVKDLPSDFPAAVFIVWHMPPEAQGLLPQILEKSGNLSVTKAFDGEEIKNSKIYVSPLDRHLLVERGFVRVARGPKENRFRPAIDPLLRSATYNYGRHMPPLHLCIFA